MFWLFEIRESDGNDCNVFDAIVSADSRKEASVKLWKHLASAYPGDESDGGYGTFHPCTCEIPEGEEDRWECSHGGLLTNEDVDGEYGPRAFETYEDAKEAGSISHGTIALLCEELK
jgi:hypothetical protein